MGCNVVVVDLQPLLGSSPADPETVAKFTFAKPNALSAQRFSASLSSPQRTRQSFLGRSPLQAA